MEKYHDLPTVQELYSLYGIKEAICHIPRSTWEVPQNFGTEVEEIMSRIAETYLSRPLPQFSHSGDVFPPPDIPHEELVLHEAPLNCDPSVSCRVFEVAGISSVVERDRKKWALWLRMKRGGDIICDSFLLHENDDEWNFSHRLVPQAYRGKKLFTHFSSAQESFVQQRANRLRSTQSVYVNTGQPDVLLAFLKRGYDAANTREQETIDRVLNPDGRLILAHARKPAMLEGGDGHQAVPAETTSLYCFERHIARDGSDPAMLTMEKSLRIRLEKKFPPL